MDGDPAPAAAAVADARRTASNASLYAQLAVALALLGMCSSCMTLYLALPVALVAIHQARQVMESDDELVRYKGRTAMTLGLMSASYSTVWILIMIAYILLYAGMIGLALFGAAVAPPPQPHMP